MSGATDNDTILLHIWVGDNGNVFVYSHRHRQPSANDYLPCQSVHFRYFWRIPMYSTRYVYRPCWCR